MEQRYLIDTNVVIDYFGDKLPKNAVIFFEAIDLNFSVVSKIEVLGWFNATQNQLNPLISFMDVVNIIDLNKSVIDKTILIRQTKRILLGDAIIAATAIVNNLTLMTRNISDFKNIEGLIVLEPHQL